MSETSETAHIQVTEREAFIALSGLAMLGHLSQRERQGVIDRYTHRCMEMHPLSPLQTPVYRNIAFLHSQVPEKTLRGDFALLQGFSLS